MYREITNEKREQAIRYLGGVRPCEDCNAYTIVACLVDYGPLLVCRKCYERLERARIERQQQSLFGDDQPELEFA